MKNSMSCYEFILQEQKHLKENNYDEIVTVFKNNKGQIFENHIKKRKGINALECFNMLQNNNNTEITVEMIASFSITGISPFCTENNVENIFIRRLRSNWSAEGKLETFTAAELQMEDSWSSYGIRQERIGQTGSMPARKFLPFCSVEDKDAGCVWAVSTEAPMSWQIDTVHNQGSISLTGGIADFENGHFRKKIAGGESFTTYSAFLTVVEGTFEEACACLLEEYEARLNVPKSEEDLPLIYNEYCCSWGNPSMKNLQPIINECSKIGVKYFVTDVGWWRNDERSWYTLGDWNPGKILFPEGIKELPDYIRSKGMIPGIWFEFEGASCDSNLFSEHKDFFLKRDGFVIAHRERVFLDFRKEEVREYIHHKVIDLLNDNGFGYIKIDYNESLGIGCDGAESFGEGMRTHLSYVIDFFEQIKKEIPEIVIEVCSSGGMRLEPKFLSLASMASFSDAHLGIEGAVIAMDLHRYMLPRQMQIWATLQNDYSLQRLYFTMAKGMLGRYCLSGDLLKLNKIQYNAVISSIEFYQKIKDVIKDGKSLFFGREGLESLRKPIGRGYVIRQSKDKEKLLVYAFVFFNGNKYEIKHPLFEGYKIEDEFSCGKSKLINSVLTMEYNEKNDVFGSVVLLKKTQGNQ